MTQTLTILMAALHYVKWSLAGIAFKFPVNAGRHVETGLSTLLLNNVMIQTRTPMMDVHQYARSSMGTLAQKSLLSAPQNVATQSFSSENVTMGILSQKTVALKPVS